MRRRIVQFVWTWFLIQGFALPNLAGAACVAPGELKQFDRSLHSQFRCTRLTLEGAHSPCNAIAPPACAASALAAAVTLVSDEAPAGDASIPQASVQGRCQRTIFRIAEQYLGKRVLELSQGRRRARTAQSFAQVERACQGIPIARFSPSARLPTLGSPCASLVGDTVGVVDGDALSRCLRASLEAIAGGIVTGGSLRPNIVLIMTDDQNLPSAEEMAAVRRLRGQGVDFSNAFVSTPVCAPSRATLLTGLYAHHHGVLDNSEAAASLDTSSTLATWLSAAGYTTGLIGKYINHIQAIDAAPPGWDEWQALVRLGANGYDDYYLMDKDGELVRHGGSSKEYSTDLLAARSQTFIRENADRPFFLLFTPAAPHVPTIPAARHLGLLSGLAPWRTPNVREPDVSLKPSWVNFMKWISKPEGIPETDAFRIAQLETLLAVDEAITKLDATLEQLGLTDNTILLFTSDHGYHWGEHWWSGKFTPYEESLRIPLVVRYPLLSPLPARRSEMVLNLDFAPTLAELAGATIPAGRDGRSMAALFSGPGVGHEDYLIEHYGAIFVPPWEGVRGERFKYVKTEASEGITEELYDLEADPYELANLAFDPAYADVRDALRVRLSELRDD